MIEAYSARKVHLIVFKDCVFSPFYSYVASCHSKVDDLVCTQA